MDTRLVQPAFSSCYSNWLASPRMLVLRQLVNMSILILINSFVIQACIIQCLLYPRFSCISQKLWTAPCHDFLHLWISTAASVVANIFHWFVFWFRCFSWTGVYSLFSNSILFIPFLYPRSNWYHGLEHLPPPLYLFFKIRLLILRMRETEKRCVGEKHQLVASLTCPDRG